MLDARQAVELAFQEFSQLVGGISPVERSQLLLEEVEVVQDNGTPCWAITLSHPGPATAVQAMTGAVPRLYKVIRIDAETGAFKSLKIRHV